jgi:hypothetical protein
LGSIIGNGCRTIGAQEFRHFLDIVEMRSIEVRSEKTLIGLVRRLTSRKRGSMALVVLTRLRSAKD